MRKTISRRELLECAGKASIAFGLAPAFSACESMDRLILGKPRLEETVVVLGAGLAGLAAGIELKRRNIPFLIVDAANAPGGRALSLRGFGAEGEVLDLGGEWISARHALTLRLAKDLRLEMMERRPGALDKNWLKDLRAFNRALQKTSKVSTVNLSALDWIKGRTQESFFEDLARQWCHFRFGADPGDVQAFEIEKEWRGAGGAGLLTEAKFRFRQGAGALVQALYDRIGGVVPQQNFLWGYRLFAVSRRERGVTLNFQASDGPREIVTKRVVCCLPQAVLQKIEGVQQFEPKLASLKVGSQSKGGAFFPERFWAGRFDQGGGIGRLPQFLTWESLRRERLQKGGVLTWMQAGKDGAEAGLHTNLRWREEMVHAFSTEVPAPLTDHVQNWSQLSFFRGSHSVPSPGIERDQIFRSTSLDWIWAGEHTSREFPGTIEGALETGRQAGLQASEV